jgi:hypothetical protein
VQAGIRDIGGIDTARSIGAAGVALVLAVSLILGFTAAAGAHERRQVGPYVMRVGWADEPTYAGVKNGVQVLLSDASGKPFTDIPENLKVVVEYGSEKTAPLPLVAAFGRRFGQPGDFRAAIIPTRPGNYTFHFVGMLKAQRIDQSFTSSDTTFDPVQEATAIEFPAKDPSAGQLAEKVDRLGARLEDEGAAANRAQMVGGAGLLAGVLGIAVGVGAGRRRTGVSGRP